METSTLESSNEFGFGNVRHHHQRDWDLAKAKRTKETTSPKLDLRRPAQQISHSMVFPQFI